MTEPINKEELKSQLQLHGVVIDHNFRCSPDGTEKATHVDEEGHKWYVASSVKFIKDDEFVCYWGFTISKGQYKGFVSHVEVSELFGDTFIPWGNLIPVSNQLTIFDYGL